MILILGAKGMLGTSLQRVFGSEAIGWDKDDADATKILDYRGKIKEISPSGIINCVAYNDVDGAESNKEAAFLLNQKVPGDLALICNELDIPLVHFSSNYVFDGQKGFYTEDDQPLPLSVYGNSKLEGERAVSNSAKKFYIVRTSVLFGPPGTSLTSKRSFVDLMLDIAQKQNFVGAIEDEFNSLTYSPDLALAIKQLLKSELLYGVYHIANSGRASWYDFAQEIFKIARPGFLVKPVLAKNFKRAAKRPKSAVLVTSKLSPLRPWPDALAEFLQHYRAKL